MIIRVVGLNLGGGCRVHVDQLNYFLEEEKLIKTTTFIPLFKRGDTISDGKSTKYCYINKWRLIKFIYYLFFKRKKIKVIHLHLKNAIILYGLLCIFFRYKYIVTIHQNPFSGSTLRSRLSDILFIQILKRSKKVISISKFIANSLLDKSIPSTVIYNYSNKYVEKKAYLFPAKLGKKICLVGELTERKGITDVPNLAKLLPYGYILQIYGHGPLSKICKNHKNVKLLGHVPPNKIYKDNDILLSLSFNEPFGRTITEAYKHYMPVIARNSGAFPELVDSKFLFNNIDEIPGLLKVLQNENSESPENFYYKIEQYAQKFNKYNFEKKHWEVLKCYCT